MKIKLVKSESIQNQKSMLLQYAWRTDLRFTRSIRMRTIPASTGTARHSIRCCKPQANIGLMWYWPKRNPVSPVTWSSWKSICTEVHGVGRPLHCVVDHVDTNDTANKKSRQINGLINEWYLEDLSTNVRSVLDTRGKRVCSSALLRGMGIAKTRMQKENLSLIRKLPKW